jgi:branched-chain amino acid transport system permease protein
MGNRNVWLWGIPIFIVLALFPLLATTYILHLGVFVLIYILLTISVGLVLGYIGELSFGHAAFYGIGGYASALLTVKLGLSFWLALPLAVIITAVFGLVIGALSLRTRGHYFALVTLGFGEIIHIFANNWESLTGGSVGFRGIKAPDPVSLGFLQLKFDTKTSMYYLTLIITCLVLFLVYRFIHSHIGRIFIAIREDKVLGEFVGLPTFRYKLLNFTVSSAIAGLGGVLSAHYILYISPDFFTLTQSVNMVLMVVVGGVATVAGPVVGAITLTVLLELFNIAQGYKMMLYGLFLMLFIVFLPNGIMGLFRGKIRFKRNVALKNPEADSSVR